MCHINLLNWPELLALETCNSTEVSVQARSSWPERTHVFSHFLGFCLSMTIRILHCCQDIMSSLIWKGVSATLWSGLFPFHIQGDDSLFYARNHDMVNIMIISRFIVMISEQGILMSENSTTIAKEYNNILSEYCITIRWCQNTYLLILMYINMKYSKSTLDNSSLPLLNLKLLRRYRTCPGTAY